MRVLVLGGSGMLGSMVADVLARNPRHRVTATVRTADLLDSMKARIPEATWVFAPSLDDAVRSIDGHEWVINAIGVTKPFIRDEIAPEIERAIEVNAVFPHQIGRRALEVGARVLQIATDAVFSGLTGGYDEATAHDPPDVYGKTKSLGEAFHESMHHLRCSIIGPESGSGRFLVEWFRRQPAGAELRGFVNHRWNGVTTLHFARLCQGLLANNRPVGHLQHIVPGGSLTKAEMLHLFAEVFERRDVRIVDIEAPVPADRTLSTRHADLNRSLWNAAGYGDPPSVEQMVAEMAAFDYRRD